MLKISKGNLLDNIPVHFEKEIFDILAESPGLSIKRVLSQGQVTDWLKEDMNEWVVLFSGSAKLLFEDGGCEVEMRSGDHLCIPAGCRHRVSWTDPRQKTVWLAVHYK